MIEKVIEKYDLPMSKDEIKQCSMDMADILRYAPFSGIHNNHYNLLQHLMDSVALEYNGVNYIDGDTIAQERLTMFKFGAIYVPNDDHIASGGSGAASTADDPAGEATDDSAAGSGSPPAAARTTLVEGISHRTSAGPITDLTFLQFTGSSWHQEKTLPGQIDATYVLLCNLDKKEQIIKNLESKYLDTSPLWVNKAEPGGTIAQLESKALGKTGKYIGYCLTRGSLWNKIWAILLTIGSNSTEPKWQDLNRLQRMMTHLAPGTGTSANAGNVCEKEYFEVLQAKLFSATMHFCDLQTNFGGKTSRLVCYPQMQNLEYNKLHPNKAYAAWKILSQLNQPFAKNIRDEMHKHKKIKFKREYWLHDYCKHIQCWVDDMIEMGANITIEECFDDLKTELIHVFENTSTFRDDKYDAALADLSHVLLRIEEGRDVSKYDQEIVEACESFPTFNSYAIMLHSKYRDKFTRNHPPSSWEVDLLNRRQKPIRFLSSCHLLNKTSS